MTSPPHILLVEDQSEMELIVRHLVRRMGLEMTARSDVETAWQHLIAGARRPNLVLLDVNLPGPSGLELCRRLRTDPAWVGLPVALFSHWERSEEIHAALRIGADFVLTKDLVAHPEAWKERLAEIFQDLDSRPPPHSLCSPRTDSSLPECGAEEWLSVLNRALARLPLHSLEADLTPILARRALLRRCEGGTPSAEPILSLISALDKLTPNLRNFPRDLRPLTQHLDSRQRQTFSLALAEQLRYTFGTKAVAAFHGTLARVLVPTGEP